MMSLLIPKTFMIDISGALQKQPPKVFCRKTTVPESLF